MKDQLIVVAGGGGFIGGHLIAEFRKRGFKNLRSVDVKPTDEWYEVFDDVENLVLDLQEKENCYTACKGATEVYQLAADMGFSRRQINRREFRAEKDGESIIRIITS